MKKYLLSSAVAAAIFAVYLAVNCLSSSPALAQQPSMQPRVPLPNVALVDVSYILKKHVRLKAALTDLTREGDAVQKQFEEQLKALQDRAKPLGPGGYKAGSPEYNALEEQLVKERSAIRTNIELKRKEFMQREAKLYNNAYREISDEVRYYCEQRGIAMVLNFNGDAIHDDDPQDVARGISNKVVFYNRDLDITPIIKARFERDLPANPSGPAAFNPPQNR